MTMRGPAPHPPRVSHAPHGQASGGVGGRGRGEEGERRGKSELLNCS